MADLSDQIESAASGPKQVTVDGTVVQSHDLAQLVQADQYLAAKAASRKRHRGMRITRMVPPGAVSTDLDV